MYSWMIYPNNFEQKIGFNEIRQLLRGYCLSTLGKEKVDEMAFSSDSNHIRQQLLQLREFRHLLETAEDFPLANFFDTRDAVTRIRLEGTHMEEEELFNLQRSLATIIEIVDIFRKNDGEERPLYPTLHGLTEGIITFPHLVRQINSVLDKFGKIKDSASVELMSIRRELAKAEGNVTRTLYSILRSAQSEGVVEKDVTPTIRDGRLVIPVVPGLKRKIKGIVHDESSTGKTVFIEPTEVVEANNHIRELENREKKEIIRILKAIADDIRPCVADIMESFQLMADVDMLQAKTSLAKLIHAIEPEMVDHPHIDWAQAKHPLLYLSLTKQGKKIVPLDITLQDNDKEQPAWRLLVISGPNAGGKSICLKTIGLLQYMLQCGLSIPVGDNSTVGVFEKMMIDIGDEQSIENDLSTYSSHLLNMKNMIRYADNKSLLLIDEFGTGTEPQIGGAIAEAVLTQFVNKQAWGVITTHYQNLKHFAEDHEGVVNGAMLYDRNQMQALFQLAIGRPGSSFAIEIARKIGLPEQVISDATDIVGSEYIQSDKYLQDIVRDKRYWENKRQNIHKREKDIERTINRYETNLTEIDKQRKEILRQAKEQAKELLAEANRRIENTIREIKEAQAEKEETKRIREDLNAFKEEVETVDKGIMTNEEFQKKLKQIEERKQRKEKHRKEKHEKEQKAAEALRKIQQRPSPSTQNLTPTTGDTVRIKGQNTVGTIESDDGKTATVIFGGMRTRVALSRLEHADAPKEQQTKVSSISRMTRNTIDERRRDFHQDIDIRGMRADEALQEVQDFIDDAILVGVGQVRILHGKGNGILRQLIRQYLKTIPNIAQIRDEHVQFGGAGITVATIEN